MKTGTQTHVEEVGLRERVLKKDIETSQSPKTACACEPKIHGVGDPVTGSSRRRHSNKGLALV